MKRIFCLLALPLLGATIACNRATDTTHVSLAPAGGARPPAHPVAPAPLLTPYEVHGVVDPDLHNLVAFALKVPQGWRLRQSLTREWNGTTPITQVYLRLLAPDGQQQIELLPERPYYYVDGPQARSLRYVAAAAGTTPPPSPYELAPLSAMGYLKQVLLPRLTQRGLHLAASGEHQQALPPQGPATRRSSAYVDGRLPNGRLARIECQVNITPTTLNGEVYYNWTVLPSITQSPADLAPVFAHVAVVRTSLVCNPAWQQQNQQLASNGQRPDQVATSSYPASQQDFQSYQQKTGDEVAANRQRSQGNTSESLGDALRSQARYADPTAGERGQADDRYRHVYRPAQSATLSTDAPLDARHVDWQELQRVELNNQ